MIKPLILAIVPVIIRRLRRPWNRITASPSVRLAKLSRGGRLQRRPQKPRELARDRHGDLGRGLVLFDEAPEAATQSLLRFICNRNHSAWLTFAPACERGPYIRSVLIVPRRFNEQAADEPVTRARDAAPAMLLAGRIFAGHEPQICHQRPRRFESAEIVQLRENQDRG